MVHTVCKDDVEKMATHTLQLNIFMLRNMPYNNAYCTHTQACPCVSGIGMLLWIPLFSPYICTGIMHLTDSLFRGCECILRKCPHMLNVRKPDGYGPLHLASLNGNYECAKYIIEQV